MTGAELIGQEELKEIQELFDREKVMLYRYGPKNYKTLLFEEAFAEYMGVKYAHSVSSGTAAIHSALAAIGVLVGPDTRIAAIGANETPIRLNCTEAHCTDLSNMDAVLEAAREEVSPNSDLHGSADYRRHLIGVLTKRALTMAWERAA